MVPSWSEVDIVQEAGHLLSFLLRGNTVYNWDSSNREVIGDDQIVSIILAQRLGYRTLLYAEYKAR